MMQFKIILQALFLGLILILVQNKTYAQSLQETDSLLQVVETTADDSLKVHTLNKLAFNYLFNYPDTSFFYIKKGLLLAEKKSLLYGKSQLLNTKGLFFDITGKKDSAEFFLNEALKLSQEHLFLQMEMMTLNNLGLFHWKSSHFDLALSHFSKALEINIKNFSEKEEDRANYESNIGLIYQELGQLDDAINYHKKALSTRKKLNLLNGQAISLANLGVCYFKLDNYEEAIDFYTNAIDLTGKVDNMRMYYSLHGNLANVYNKKGMDELAIKHLLISLDRPENLSANPKSDLSSYINLASIYNKLKQPKKSIEYAEKGFEILEENDYLYAFSLGLHYAFAESNYMIGNIDEGSKYMEKYRVTLDSVFSEKNANALAEIEKKYESAEKDLLILEQQQIMQQQQLKIQKRTIWFVLILMVVLIAVGILFYLYKRKELIAKQSALELDLAKQQELTHIQEERLRISRELHDNIGSYLALMSASVEHLNHVETNNYDPAKINELQDTITMSMRELRKTVWLLNKKAISIDELSLRIMEFFKPLQQNGVLVSVTKEGNEGHKLTEIQTTHLFRVIQEAVCNAYKYAESTEIVIHLKTDLEDNFYFSVSDNGKGFDEKGLAQAGNGLQNMKSRMEELNGVLNIKSNTNQGTLVEGSFKLINTKEYVLK